MPHRTVKHSILFVLTLFVLFATNTSTSAQNPSKGNPSDAAAVAQGYNYPVRPGTKAWSELKSHDEMIATAQLPAEVVSRLSTDQLLDTILSYPLLKDLLAFNNIQSGINAVSENFNGLSELRSRKDVGAVVLSKYRARGLQRQPAESLEAQGDRNFETAFLEILLAQDDVRSTLNQGQIDELVAATTSAARTKRANIDTYGYEGLESSAFLLARVLTVRIPDFADAVRSNYPLQEFLATGSARSPALIDWVLDYANRTAAGSLSLLASDYSSTVSTPNGTLVPVTVMTWELSSAQIASLNAYVANTYPLAVRETDASRKYNCHSYAWYNQSTSNNVWINTPADDTYWNDGSYIGSSSGVANRRVSYPETKDHSAIVVSSTTFRSKWGQLPRMRHAYNYCPYWSSGITLRYYVSYSLSTSPQTITLYRGSTATFYIYAETDSGFRGTISYYAIGLPGNQVLPGTGFSPQSVSVQADYTWYVSTFKIYTNSATPRGYFAIRVEGRSSGKTVAKYVYLNIL